MKVAYILSYKYPKYVRTQYILQLLDRMDDITVVKAMNTSTGVLRYVQTIAKLVRLRVVEKPDVYMLGFRGTELFWLVRLITAGKPLIYDEFLNPYLWTIEEHKKFKKGSVLEKLVRFYTKYTLNAADYVLSDTYAHASYSFTNFGISSDKFTTLYVGTDEKVFTESSSKEKDNKKSFNVFFYGNFLPLHGINHIINAAEALKDKKDIQFTIIGGANRKEDMEVFLADVAKRKLNNVEHKPWVEYEELPDYIRRSDLCLGGPFAGTPQAQKVITGKAYQFLSIAKPTIIGAIDEEVGFVDKRNCLLIKQGSTDELVANILWAYENQDKLAKIGKSGQDLYKKKFSQAAQQKVLRSVLDRAVQ